MALCRVGGLLCVATCGGGGGKDEEHGRSRIVPGFVLRETAPIVALKHKARLIQDVTSRCSDAIYVT